MSRVEHIVVAVPARNEEQLLGRCLRRLLLARRSLRRSRPTLAVDIIVTLDSCTDNSAAAVARAGVVGVPARCGCVGGARDLAVRTGLARASGHRARDIWIANTDADSAVPMHWLTTQVELAEAGHDLIVGTVEPVGDIDPRSLANWQARHELIEGHRHVHGANLGVRADAWLAVGGFGALTSHEDVRLVSRLRSAGVSAVATDRIRVQTSARLASRVPSGFSSYLAELTDAPDPLSGSCR